MSTLKVVNVQHPSASEPSITLDSDGGMSGSFPSPNRNLVYNGAMQVHQRGTSVVGIMGGGYYTADRWYADLNTMGIWTQSVENDAPTGSGFRKSLKMLCRTADADPAAGDYALVMQSLEGQDVQRIAKGTASAQQLSVSFWVKANVTGTYIVSLYDNDNSRFVSASYTISASATWERKTVTFPADATGVFDNDNEASLRLYFALAAGSSSTSGTLGTAWGAFVQANWLVGQTNLAAATNNYWQVTGVQLETGAVATPFEFKSYGQELAECQRYFEAKTTAGFVGGFVSKTSGVGGGGGSIFVPFLVEKRAAPILNNVNVRNANTNAILSVAATSISTFGAHYSTSLVPGTVGDAIQINGTVSISAEL